MKADIVYQPFFAFYMCSLNKSGRFKISFEFVSRCTYRYGEKGIRISSLAFSELAFSDLL